MALRECLEAHEDHVDLLYLTDSEASLQAIHKWIGYGARLNLSKSPDADILKAIILKLQKRVEAGSATLLIKVKVDRGDPLNEEADIRTELGRRKEYKETIWDNLSGRTGHIQHTCEALSKTHTMVHHRCWHLIHGELSRLTSSA